jgi:hypothetical protein
VEAAARRPEGLGVVALIDALASATRPVVIGVRHHSAALAAAMPALLDSFAPPAIYLELPVELGHWLPWLGHPETLAPVVLAASREGRTAMYPFADFSPELQAVRWAVRHDVPVHPIDAPVATALPSDPPREAGLDVGRFWDDEVEARAGHSSPEALRRAGLAVGLALREHGPSPSDRVREHCMRAALADCPEGAVAVVGAFHGAALFSGPDAPPVPVDEAVTTSLGPYSWDLFDSRSGYPAGVHDPALQQAFYEAFATGAPVEGVLGRALVDLCRHLRRAGHPASVPDATEALRMAVDLASLRGRRHPGRRELLEAVESTLSQGQRLGRGRALARAMQTVFVGDLRGRVAHAAPRSGLLTAVVATLAELSLPGPEDADKRQRLDPMRSEVDHRRALLLVRLRVMGVRYGEQLAGDAESLGSTWQLAYTPSTDATLELAGRYGQTVPVATAGRLRQRRRREAPTAANTVAVLADAAEAGVLDDDLSLTALLGQTFLDAAGMAELVDGLRLLSRVAAGHCLGTPPTDLAHAPLLRAAVRQVEALAGTTDDDEIRALAELDGFVDDGLRPLFLRALARLSRDGGPHMQGASRILLGDDGAGVWLASVVDAAASAEQHRALLGRLRGALLVASSRVTGDDTLLGPLCDWVDRADEAVFLDRLPSLRGGFDALSPAARDRFLGTLLERYGDLQLELTDDPVVLGRQAAADAEAQAVVEARFGAAFDPLVVTDAGPLPRRDPRGPDRWRLILGRQREALPAREQRMAAALDELYGRGRGEGARGGRGGGTGTPFPESRAWGEALEDLFGETIREEVLAAAAEGGRASAAAELDPDAVRPSVDLLCQVLALAGSLGEGRLAKLRPLVRRLVDALTAALARQVRPALTGPATGQRTFRTTPHLDLAHTLRRNLGTVQHTDDGPMLVPDRLVFRTGSRKTMAWDLFLAVDVSGSMEPSVVYAAMMSAILAGAPFLTVRFVAFDTRVIDLSEHAADPLALLLEAKVGGGTDIASAVQYVGAQVRVPSRSILVVVSDFEEGGSPAPLLEAVRRLVSAGVTCLGVAALEDGGAPRYHAGIAGSLVRIGMPVAAVSPLELARWVSDVVHG